MKKKSIYDLMWSPKQYLKNYYSSGITKDEKCILNFIVSFLKEKKIKFKEMLEIGSGPTIHHIIPFANHADKVYMADYLKSNLAEIKKWFKRSPHAHDWTKHISEVLNIEGKKSKSSIKQRISALNKRIAGFIECNLLTKQPIYKKKVFPLVTSFYCLECITSSKKQWFNAMTNLSSLIAPNGWLILSALRNTNKYLIFGKSFPTVRIKENDVRKSLIQNGFNPKTIKIKICPCKEYKSEGFESIIVCSAQKM